MAGRSIHVALLVLLFMVSPATAGTGTGRLLGYVTLPSGEPAADVTVWAEGPQGEDATLTEADGRYVLTDLPVGTYAVFFAAGDSVISKPIIHVSANQTVRVDGTIATKSEVETMEVVEDTPRLDVGSSRLGLTLKSAFVENIPAPLDTGALFQRAPGAYQDDVGVSLNGASGAENAYFVDGLNVTSIQDGLLGTNLPRFFLEEVELVSGGYGADIGRSLSGVVNMTTKSGSNVFKGSAFSYWTLGGLSPNAERVFDRGTALSLQTQLDNRFVLGTEIGGPIVKDRLFFWAGYVPTFSQTTFNRYAARFVDDGTGQQANLADGRPQTEPLYDTPFDGDISQHQYGFKVNWNPDARQKASLAWYGTLSDDTYLSGANRDPLAALTRDESNVQDIIGRWVGNFLNGRLRLVASVGYHGERISQGPESAEAAARNEVTWQDGSSLGRFDSNPAVLAGCTPVGGFNPCPANNYVSGGFGTMFDYVADRWAAKVEARYRFRLGGWHELSAGVDVERNSLDNTITLSGTDGARGRIRLRPGAGAGLTQFRYPQGTGGYNYRPGPDGEPAAPLADLYGAPFYQDQTRAKTTSQNLAVFLQESYTPVANLTLNLGLRLENQSLTDLNGNTALEIGPNLSPRLGFVLDPSNEGRTRVFGHYGHYYQSVPMSLSDTAFGSRGLIIGVYPETPFCPDGLGVWGETNGPWQQCNGTVADIIQGGEVFPVQPNIKGTFSDEFVLGGQWQVFDNIVLGTALSYRRMQNIIEDVDGLLTNPGNLDQSVIDRAEAAAIAAEERANQPGASAQDFDAARQARDRANLTNLAAELPAPRRTYKALQLTATRQLEDNWSFQASYTYSRLRGNYMGMYTPNKRQLNPNLTAQFESLEIMQNREGVLPNDRPHLFRFDGFYIFDFDRFQVSTGAGYQIRSGVPINALGAYRTSQRETYILPQGSVGRTPTVQRLDLHVAGGMNLPRDMRLEVFLDVFNVFNQQTVLRVDEEYTVEDVNAIEGGVTADLAGLTSAVPGPDGEPVPISANPNYRAPVAFQAPISARLGMRLRF